MSVFTKNIFRKFVFGWMVSMLILVSTNRSSAQETQDTISAPPIEEYTEDEEEEEYQQATLTADTPVLRHVPLPVVTMTVK